MSDLILDDNQIVERFLLSLRSEGSKRTYRRWIHQITNGDPGSFLNLARNNRWQGQEFLISWVLKERERLAPLTVQGMLSVMKSLCEYAEITLSWSKIRRVAKKRYKVGKQEPVPYELVQKLYESADLRLKWILGLFMSGLRVGAFDWGFQVKHLSEVRVSDELIIGVLRVYPGEPEECLAFLTPEALENWHEYRKFREQSGETITSNSPLVRTVFDRSLGSSLSPLRRVTSRGIYELFRTKWTEVSGQTGIERPFKTCHGFRSLFRTLIKTPGIVDREDAEHMTGHKDPYFKPELLNTKSDEFNMLLSKFAQVYYKVELSKASEAKRVAAKAVKEKNEIESSIVTEVRLLRLEKEQTERENKKRDRLIRYLLTLEDLKNELALSEADPVKKALLLEKIDSLKGREKELKDDSLV
jgi:integrase